MSGTAASGPAASDDVTWRLAGPPLLLRLVPLVAIVWYAASGLLRLLAADRVPGSGDGLLVVGNLLLLVAAVAAAVVTARTHVTISDAGVAVRETSTRFYPWTEIRAVRGDVPSRPRLVLLELDGDRRRVLPVPSGSLRRKSDTTVPDAIELLRQRLDRHRPPTG